MTTTPYLPEDPQARFREIYDALNAERRWWRHASPLRFAAMAALTCPDLPRQAQNSRDRHPPRDRESPERRRMVRAAGL